MTDNMKTAKDLLLSEGYTCVFVKDGEIFSSRERGVKPLLEFLDSGKVPRGFSAADKVIGRAAAFLYVLLGAKEVYAGVISRGAKEVFDNFGIACAFDTLTDGIINRKGDGPCPMESAVTGEDDPKRAVERIRECLRCRTQAFC